MAKISDSAMKEIREAFRQYEREVNRSSLKDNTRKTYLLHSGNFVRWLEGRFTPGERAGL